MKLLLQGFFWFLFALHLRLLLMLFLHFYSVQTGFEGFFGSGGDDRYYHDAAMRLAKGEEMPSLPNIYPLVLAWLYSLFGPHLIVGKLVNVLLGSLSVYYGVRIANLLESGKYSSFSLTRPSNLAGLFLAVYPSSLFYSALLVRDSFILFLGTVSLYWGLKLLKKPHLREFVLLPLSLAALFSFRGYAAVAFLFAFSVYYLSGVVFFNIQRALVGVFLAIVLPMFLGWGPAGFGYLLPLLDIERLSPFREGYSAAASGVGISLDFSNPLSFLFSYAYSFITALLGPLPWQVKNTAIAIPLIEAMPFWFLFLIAFKKKSRISREASFLLLFAFIYLGGVALFSDNIGSNTRLRLLPWSALLIYFALRLGRSSDVLFLSHHLHHPR